MCVSEILWTDLLLKSFWDIPEKNEMQEQNNVLSYWQVVWDSNHTVSHRHVSHSHVLLGKQEERGAVGECEGQRCLFILNDTKTQN